MFKRAQTPSMLIIGDSLYFDLPLAKRKKLVFEKNLNKNFKTSYEVKETQNAFVSITICIAPNEQILGIYENEKYLQMSECSTMDLGCDTASFTICVEGKAIDIDTMSDGYFGCVETFSVDKEDYGVIITLLLDKSAVSIDSVKQKIKYIMEA